MNNTEPTSEPEPEPAPPESLESPESPESPPERFTAPPAEGEPPRHPSPLQRSLPFESLADGRAEVLIEYRGQMYRLRATRNGKLILNK